jgi:hypothetical protein
MGKFLKEHFRLLFRVDAISHTARICEEIIFIIKYLRDPSKPKHRFHTFEGLFNLT